MTTIVQQIEEALRNAAPQAMLERAQLVATLAHKDQTRNDGTPYITHPAEIVSSLRDEFGINDENTLITAWLHDVVEDCEGIEIDDIERWFGFYVANWVDQLTTVLPKDSRPLQRHETKRAMLLSKTITMEEQAIWVKAVDRLHNLRSMESANWSEKAKQGYATDGVLLLHALNQRFVTLTSLPFLPVQSVVCREAAKYVGNVADIIYPKHPVKMQYGETHAESSA